MLGRLAPQSDEERAAIQGAGVDGKRVLTGSDIVASAEIYLAVTGITDGPLLEGVRFLGGRAQTHSLVLRCETMTRRFITTEHQLAER
jgi:fructose-1,6-bisphosphatase II